jgi:acyl carrier protein
MTNTETTRVPSRPDEISTWLRERVGYYLQLPSAEIDPDESLSESGLDSVYAFALCADIEDTLGMAVEPTLLWDVDTVSALTKHLTETASE